jgi:hypothetical protein
MARMRRGIIVWAEDLFEEAHLYRSSSVVACNRPPPRRCPERQMEGRTNMSNDATGRRSTGESCRRSRQRGSAGQPRLNLLRRLAPLGRLSSCFASQASPRLSHTPTETPRPPGARFGRGQRNSPNWIPIDGGPLWAAQLRILSPGQIGGSRTGPRETRHRLRTVLVELFNLFF